MNPLEEYKIESLRFFIAMLTSFQRLTVESLLRPWHVEILDAAKELAWGPAYNFLRDNMGAFDRSKQWATYGNMGSWTSTIFMLQINITYALVVDGINLPF